MSFSFTLYAPLSVVAYRDEIVPFILTLFKEHSLTVVCHEAHINIECVNFKVDRSSPSGGCLQKQALNHLKLLWSKALVVSVKEQAGLNLSGMG